MKASHRKLLTDLLALPTSPLNEQYVMDYIVTWAEARPGITIFHDEYGNLLMRLWIGKARSSRPLVLAAHMDHPGFESERMLRNGRLLATWRGYVKRDYFPDARVRFFDGDKWIRGRIREIKMMRDRGRMRVKSVEVEVSRPVPARSIGMWDLPDPTIRGSRVHARGCDDVAGLAAILAAFDELRRQRANLHVYALFTRAEEVGFAGAIAACHSHLLDAGSRVVAVECSSVLPGVEMGGGPILRVGDSRTVFTPDLTLFCQNVADDLAKRDRQFAYQRKLMDGGACESTAYHAFGFETTGLCMALGNYHNMNTRRETIAAECIDLDDWSRLVKWFVALAKAKPSNSPAGDPDWNLFKLLQERHRLWSGPLKKTATQE